MPFLLHGRESQWKTFSKESSPYLSVAKSLIKSANAAVAHDASTESHPRFTRRIPTFFWKFIRGLRTEHRQRRLLKRLEQLHETLNRDYVRNLQELAVSPTITLELAAHVAEVEANMAEIQKAVKNELAIKLLLSKNNRSLERRIASVKAKVDTLNEAIQHPKAYDLAHLSIAQIQEKVGIAVKEDLIELSRDDCIIILQSLEARGFKFNDFFADRDVPIETAKISGRGDDWYRNHLAGHLGIDTSKGAEDRLLDREVMDLVGCDESDPEDLEPPSKRRKMDETDELEIVNTNETDNI